MRDDFVFDIIVTSWKALAMHDLCAATHHASVELQAPDEEQRDESLVTMSYVIGYDGHSNAQMRDFLAKTQDRSESLDLKISRLALCQYTC